MTEIKFKVGKYYRDIKGQIVMIHDSIGNNEVIGLRCNMTDGTKFFKPI